MEERNIKQKIQSGYIKLAVVMRIRITRGSKEQTRYEIHFKDDDMDIPLDTQRQGTRRFSSLDAAANTIERIGLKSFAVHL